jgi:hypothetical protein
MIVYKMAISIDTDKFFRVLIISFLAIEIVSWFLSKVAGTPMLRGGWVLILFALITFLISLYNLGQNINGKNIIFAILVFIVVLLMFFLLPKFMPQLFSTYGMEDTIKSLGG